MPPAPRSAAWPSLPRRPLLALPALLAAAPARAQGAEPRLGALFPFSGPLAPLGDEGFRGLEMAVEERNAQGGLFGRPIRLAKGDATDPAQASAEARRLIGVEKVGALFGTYSSALALPASQVAELQGLCYLELLAVADALTAHGFAAHTDQRNNQLRIVNNHCPFGDVAIEHPVICAVDRGMVKGMLGALYGGDADVSLQQSLPQGDTFCATAV